MKFQPSPDLMAILLLQELLISYTQVLKASIWEKGVAYVETNTLYSLN
jgi:hypothetical protein